MSEYEQGKNGGNGLPETVLDLSRLRLSQNFAEQVGVKKALVSVPVRKPLRQEFVRVYDDNEYRLETAILELKDERAHYLVDPELWQALAGELVPKMLYTAINRQNVLFIWPTRLPGEDGKLDPWNASAHQAAAMARKSWVRVQANMGMGAYDVFEAMGTLEEPEWPEKSFADILDIAFRDRYIQAMDHPVLRRLRGEL